MFRSLNYCCIICAFVLYLLACSKTEYTPSVKKENISLSAVGDSTGIVLVDSTITSDTLISNDLYYTDGIFEMQSDTPQSIIIAPVYRYGLLPCSIDSSGFATCIFDETDIDGDGKKDIPGANRNKLIISTESGAIDLLSSFQQGIFGISPLNGQKKDITFYYRLGDGNKKPLRKITLRLLHYFTMNDIPANIKSEISSRQLEYSLYANATLSGYVISYKPKRPPLIIIISSK